MKEVEHCVKAMVAACAEMVVAGGQIGTKHMVGKPGGKAWYEMHEMVLKACLRNAAGRILCDGLKNCKHAALDLKHICSMFWGD